MFDVGISEIMVIAVVALIVLGPEKLPKTARTLGHLFGRLQRYVSDVKADINRELALDELKKMQAEVKSAATDIESSLTLSAQEVEANVRAVEASLNAATAGGTTTPVASDAAAPVASDATPAAGGAIAREPAAQAVADAPSAQPASGEAPRQGSLPGFERG